MLDYGYPWRIQIATNELFYLFMDLDPSESGRKGQIIFRERDGDEEMVVADTFGCLLRNFIEDLKTGKYIFKDYRLFYAPDGDIDSSPIERYEDFVPTEFLQIK